jgi:hypothetical protein
VVFRNALLLCGVCAQNSLVLLKTGGGINRDEEGRSREVWFGNRDKMREGVTRLIKLFYQSNSRIYKFKILFSIIFKTI